MMTLNKSVLAIAAVASIALSPAIASAEENETVVSAARVASDAPVGYVAFRDLNLGNEAGVMQLRARIKRVANNICISDGLVPLGIQAVEKDCARAAVASAEPQLARAVESYRSRDFASLTPIAIVGGK
jgi:UrcA family protein